MARIFTKECDICGLKALRRESFYINPAATSKRYLVCKRCGKTLATFLQKHGLYKTMQPKSVGSKKVRKLKTRRK